MERQMEYERNLNHTYLVCRQDGQERYYEVQMLLNNKIPGVLPCRQENKDGVPYLYYEITSKQSVCCLYQKQKLTFGRLDVMFGSLYKMILKLEDYLIPVEYIVLDPEFIFADVEQREFCFCIVPGNVGSEEALRNLLEYLLEHIDYEDEKAVATTYEWYRRAGEENSSFVKIYEETFGARQGLKKQEGKQEGKQEPTGGRWEKHVSAKECNPQEEWESGLLTEPTDRNRGSSWESIGNHLKEHMNKVCKDKKWLYVMGVAVVAIIALGVMWLIDDEMFWKVAPGAGMLVGVVGYVCHSKTPEYDICLEESRDDALWDEDQSINGYGDHEHGNNYEGNGYEGVIYEADKGSLNGQNPGQISQSDDEDVTCGQTVFFSDAVKEESRRLESVEGKFPGFEPEVFPFIIGKLRDAVDGVIPHETVSRIHCRIDKDQENYYITDLNSTNGTIVNGELLNTNERILLQEGDEIQLGKAVYVFR